MSGGIIDWRLAERTAGAIGGSPDRGVRPYQPREVIDACAEAISAVAAYARMDAPPAPPEAELISRRQWSDSALATLAAASEPIEARVQAGISLPGPLGSVVRRVIGGGAGAEAGLAVGYASRRVLGQYDVSLFGGERPGRLLFVGPNLDHARRELDADADLFLRWVALHECTHVLQFSAVEWLVPHLRKLVGQLIDSAVVEIDAKRIGALAKRFLRDPRALARTVMRGELARTLADPESRAMLDRLQATMTVIEGHAEHVMDACAADDPRLGELRKRLEERRASRGGLGEIVARLLGLELKMRQYELGKKFWDAVVAERGEAVLEQVWTSETSLPTLAELERPSDWLDRVAPPIAAR